MSSVARMRLVLLAVGMASVLFGLACSSSHPAAAPAPPLPTPATRPAIAPGIHKIRHVVVIMQENRSFDSYFGTFPGAAGLPRDARGLTSCVPDPGASSCARPFHDGHDVNAGSAHGIRDSAIAVDGGKMDGFVRVARRVSTKCAAAQVQDPSCTHASQVDVMGYHDAREIPNYWKYASDFVLQDHMFAPVASWSLPSHLYEVSGWSAACLTARPRSCVNNADLSSTLTVARNGLQSPLHYAWTDLTYLLHAHQVSWGYYVESGAEPDCANDAAICKAVAQDASTPGIWNPLPRFEDVRENGQLSNIQNVGNFEVAASTGALPAVSWIAPSQVHSEHPPASVHAGQAWVTKLINDVMQGPDWASTAIFVSWDDWGGFYDHVVPPHVDRNGYGIRVPGLVVSPYAKHGYIDHQVLSHDAYLKFIEDDFLGGQRIDPLTDGRPDPRPTVRENVGVLGDLSSDFDFHQTPRRPEILPTDPPPGAASSP